MTSQPLYMKPHPVCRVTCTLYMWHRNHYLCHHTHCIDNIIPTVCMTSHSPYVWQRLHDRRHHILTLWSQTTVFMSSHPLYLTSFPLYLCHHIHCIDVITPTQSMRLHPLWFMTSYPLYTTWQPLYLCLHTHLFNDITPFVCMTSHSLYV